MSLVLAITYFEPAMVENPRVQLETNKFVVFLLKLVGLFLTQAQHVCVKTEAQYGIRELIEITCVTRMQCTLYGNVVGLN